jgi:DNA-binding winged helix-turn-helix (wHTH) protein
VKRVVGQAAPPDSSPAVAVTVQVTLPAGTTGGNAEVVNVAARLAEDLHAVAADTTSGAEIATSVALLVDRDGDAPAGRTAPRRPVFPRAVDPAHRPAALQILTERREALLVGRPMVLTRREYDLLLFLASHPGRVFTRPQLLKWVWGHTIISGERTIDVHVRRLRTKLLDLGPTITTVRGIGYRLDDVDRVAVVKRPSSEQLGSGVRVAND